MNNHDDFFDKIMNLPFLNLFQPFYSNNKEILLYLFFGGITVFLNISIFIFIDKMFAINELINNAFCWVICVFFQFFTNRKWVFNNYTSKGTNFVRQLLTFFAGRGFTLLLEEVIILIFISWLSLNVAVVKLAAQFIVIVTNYIISKMIVFKTVK